MKTSPRTASPYLEILRDIEQDPYPHKDLRREQVEIVHAAVRQHRVLERRKELLKAQGSKPIYRTELQRLDRDYGNEVSYRNGYVDGLFAALVAVRAKTPMMQLAGRSLKTKRWRDSILDGRNGEQESTWSKAPPLTDSLPE